MISDLLRSAKIVPEFSKALDVHLVEMSPVLVKRQKKTLEKSEAGISWHKDVSTLPDGPLIVVGNEFVDALPIDQFVKTAKGWCERHIGLIEGKLRFGLNPIPVHGIAESLPARLRSAPNGSVLERRKLGCLRELASRIARSSGAALIVDYGERQTKLGNTLQAVREHEFADPFELPGETDLTSLVDFEVLGAVTKEEGARVFGPIGQGVFLRRLGIEPRAQRLKKRADAKTCADIDTALARLVGESPRQMGDLFKVLVFSHPNLPIPPGFDS
jgi:SAM-dependent MidA family methyltransferase